MTGHTVRRLAKVLLAGLLVTGSFAAPVSAGAFGSDPAPAGPADAGEGFDRPVALGDVIDGGTDIYRLTSNALHSQNGAHTLINATVELRRIKHTAGRVEVTAVYDDYPSSGFRIQLPSNRNVAVRSTNGFVKQTGNTYAWDGSTSSPSVTYRLNPNMSVGPGHSAIDAGKWALLRGSEVSPRPANPVRREWWDGLTYKPHGQGAVVGGIIYLGPYQQRSGRTSSQQFRVVVTHPASGVPMTDAQTSKWDDNSVELLIDTMENVSQDLAVGERDSTVTILIGPKQVLPAEAEDAGYLLPMKELRVNGNTHPVFDTRTGIHEYVHTRQNFTEQTVGSNGQAGQQTAWLTEGQARYYEHLYACREGEITNREFLKELERGNITSATLADASTWSTKSVKYQKGALVLAALDNRIAQQTRGRKSLEDVFRRLNGHNGEINHTVFVDTVANVAGTRMDGFLRQYVEGTGAPSVPPRIACAPPVANLGISSGSLGNLRVSAHQVRAGDRVPVRAEVTGSGLPQSYTAALLVNGSAVGKRSLVVGHGTARQVAFDHEFPTPGERRVAVALFESGSLQDLRRAGLVDVRPARVPVRFRPATNTTASGTAETYNLTVGDVPNGVGHYTAEVQVNDTAVTNVTGVTVLGGSGTTTVRSDEKRARIDASGLDTDNGTVAVARVTLGARRAGAANLSATVRAVGDEDGNDYVVGATDGGVLRVQPPAGSTSLEYDSLPRLLEELEIEGLECRYPVCEELSAAGLTDDERVLLAVEGDERTHYYAGRVQEGVLTEFEPVEKPDAVESTVDIRTHIEAIEELLVAEEPGETLGRLLEDGHVTIEPRDR